jgi:uncharacterized protein YoaH (UPF0181 family)
MLGSLAKSRAARSVEPAAHSEFKRLEEPARQRSDCCSSGTSSYESEASASAGRRAGAVGGPVVGRPRWPRILSIMGLSLMKAMTLRRPPQGQARMSSRKTRRSSSLQGMRESRGRGGLVAGGGRDVSGALLEHGASAGHALAVVAHEVSPRRRDQRGETAEQLARLEDEDIAAVAEGPLHAVRKLAVGKRGKPLLRERRTGAIAAQVCQALPVVRVQMDTGVQRETLVVRGEVLAFSLVWRLATQGRYRLCLRRGERIRRPCILSQRVEPGIEESADAALQTAEDLSYVVVGEGGKRHEPDDASFADPNTVGDHGSGSERSG